MRYTLLLAVALLMFRLCGNNQQVPQPVPVEPLPEEHPKARDFVDSRYNSDKYLECLYYKEAVEGDNAWNDTVHVFHFWRELEESDYLFDEPSPEQVAAWKKLCEERNKSERAGFPDRYLNMNQYMTIWDFIEMWYSDDAPAQDDDFVLWRLAQYDDMYKYQDSEYDRFYHLKNHIQGLCMFDDQFQFELNLKAGLLSDFQEFYVRLMAREAIRHSSPKVAAALKEEEKAWLSYHKELSSAFQIIDGDIMGLNGSAWPMAICGIEEDNAQMRENSLADFYFALTDSLDYSVTRWKSVIDSYELFRQTKVSPDAVLKEYQSFMNSFEEDEYKYSVVDRKQALAKESEAWKKWMQKRQKVSSLLTGLCKDAYDNATNNVRRYKLIMLKNRYEGYGITSGDVMDCLIPYNASDEELNGPSFDEKWKLL